MYSLDSLPWSNSYAGLSDDFYSRVNPDPLKQKVSLVQWNSSAAALLGLEHVSHKTSELAEIFSGSKPLPGSEPLAMLYAGHQFGHFVPQLGDGRAIMLGEVHHPQHGRWEVQLKGSGLTPYSRDGDGRAVLRSTIREYLCSEAMYGLGIPTTRALAITSSDDEVYRERIEPAAILTRLAPSHVRFGSFEVFFYRNQFKQLRILADYLLDIHFPELKHEAYPYLALFTEVTQRTARLIAQWQAVGFAHGVMNSDNMSVLGLTLDYGPFGFMEDYRPDFICNHSDYHGRYAFDQQPEAGLFNLSCLAQALLPLLMCDHDDTPERAAEHAKSVLDQYKPMFEKEYHNLMQAKLGLTAEMPEDPALLQDLLGLMRQNRADYTIVFRDLSSFSTSNGRNSLLRKHFIDQDGFDRWSSRYTERLKKENSTDAERKTSMNRVNPKFVLRNYLAEIAIRKAEDEQDYSEIEKLLNILHHPFDEWTEFENYANHPPEWARQISVSCSS